LISHWVSAHEAAVLRVVLAVPEVVEVAFFVVAAGLEEDCIVNDRCGGVFVEFDEAGGVAAGGARSLIFIS